MTPPITTTPARTLSISISTPPQRVQDVVSDPRNLPAWATAFCRSVREEAGQWFIGTPEGEVQLRFIEPNPFGLLDHWVQLAPDVEIHVPMRVVPNGAGSEVLFTLFQPATMSAEQFATDAAMVERDLRTLKQVLEGEMSA